MSTRNPLRAACASAALLCSLITACGAPSRQEQPSPAPAPAPPPATREPYDVDTEGRFPAPPVVPPQAARGWQDTLGVLSAAPEPPHAVVALDSARASIREDTATPHVQPGYRVQIAACNDLETAQRLQRQIQTSTTLSAYIEHEPPYYKVRIGDCLDRDECRELEARLRADGWESAWIVRTPIVSP